MVRCMEHRGWGGALAGHAFLRVAVAVQAGFRCSNVASRLSGSHSTLGFPCRVVGPCSGLAVFHQTTLNFQAAPIWSHRDLKTRAESVLVTECPSVGLSWEPRPLQPFTACSAKLYTSYCSSWFKDQSQSYRLRDSSLAGTGCLDTCLC